MIRQACIYFLLCITVPTSSSHTGVVIIVHGTWANESAWCAPGSEFFEAVEQTAIKLEQKVISYFWQGHNTHASRLHAAKGLAKLIQSYPSSMNITLVAHSHGGNVCMLCSQLLAQDSTNKHTIATLYTLATPINTSAYQPDMNIIKRLYNLFSFADMVQPVLGAFARTFPEQPTVANIRLVLNDTEPGHCEFCTALTGKWLLYLHDHLKQQEIGNFQSFDFTQPGILFLYDNSEPLYQIDTHRNTLLALDHLAIETMTNIIRTPMPHLQSL